MTEEHKSAIAQGRIEAKTVSRYLEAREANKPRRGRRRTSESIQSRLDVINDQLDDAKPVERLELIQESMNLQEELDRMQSGGTDFSQLEKEFISLAKAYSERKGISYDAWRAIGVDAAVLRDAGISRSA